MRHPVDNDLVKKLQQKCTKKMISPIVKISRYNYARGQGADNWAKPQDNTTEMVTNRNLLIPAFN